MLVHHEWIFIDHFWILAPGNLEISQGIEYKLYTIFCTFSIEMYYHIVHNGSIPNKCFASKEPAEICKNSNFHTH